LLVFFFFFSLHLNIYMTHLRVPVGTPPRAVTPPPPAERATPAHEQLHPKSLKKTPGRFARGGGGGRGLAKTLSFEDPGSPR
jgi:hypothetical protein